MPTTIRTELDRLGYDWDSGKMVTQDGAGYQPAGPGRSVKKTDPLLSAVFPNGPQLHIPRFHAEDKEAVYVCQVSLNGSGLQRIEKSGKAYMNGTQIPYPDA